MEDDNKVKNPGRNRLHRSLELREYALAAFYPLTRSGISASRKHAKDDLSMIAAHPLLNLLGGNHFPPKGLVKPRGEAVAPGAITPQVERLLRLVREHGYQRSPDEPKSWKKPWDK
jgi:hypothetical protein